MRWSPATSEKQLSAGGVLEVECDVLIPAALGEAITMENEGNIKAEWDRVSTASQMRGYM